METDNPYFNCTCLWQWLRLHPAAVYFSDCPEETYPPSLTEKTETLTPCCDETSASPDEVTHEVTTGSTTHAWPDYITPRATDPDPDAVAPSYHIWIYGLMSGLGLVGFVAVVGRSVYKHCHVGGQPRPLPPAALELSTIYRPTTCEIESSA